MLPLASTSEFHAVFAADLAALHGRVVEALATLCEHPGNDSAQHDLHNALHGLKGLAGIAGSRPIESSVHLLNQLARSAASAQMVSDLERACAIFSFCRAASQAELRMLCVEDGSAASDARDVARQLRESARREWGDLLAGEFDLEDAEEKMLTSNVHSTDGSEIARSVAPVAEVSPEISSPDVTATESGAASSTGPTAEDDVLAFLQDLGVGSAAEPAPAPQPVAAVAPLVSPVTVEPGVDQEMLQYFIPETEEYCEGIENALADWEQNPASDEPRLTLLRLYHTIKGAANSIGLSALGSLAHTLEDVFEAQHAHASGDEIAAEVAPATVPLSVDAQRAIGAASVEVIRAFLRQATEGHGATAPTRGEELLACIAHLQTTARVQAAAPVFTVVVDETADTPVAATALEVVVEEKEEIAASGPVELVENLPPVRAVPSPAAIESAATTFESPGARIDSATLDRLMDLVGELSVSRNRLLAKVETFAGISKELENCKSRLLKLVNEFQERHEYSVHRLPSGNGHANGGNSRFDLNTGTRLSGFGELEFDQYDELNILARQLVEIGADTGEIIEASRRFFLGFTEDTDRFRKASTLLQDAITQVRMVPLASLLRRLRRVAVEAAGKEGKEIALETIGGETRLDKVLAEGVFSPLLHLVRNAVSHGIESPERRAAAGKSRTGKLVLRASQRSNQAIIELEDDGGGLDFEAIRRRAVRSGQLTSEEAATLPEERLTTLIFQPGFSTREAAGDVAGRGIGLDAVLQQVARLGGLIEIASRPGRGCTFTLKLPLTLAIGQAMFVSAGGQKFALPLGFVDRLVPWRPETLIHDADGQALVRVPDSTEPIPFLQLDALLGLPPQPRTNNGAAASPAGAENSLAVVARVADKRLALSIDAVLRRAETVTKPLGPLLGEHPFFSAATIDNDGSVVLILDLPRLGQGYFARRGLYALVQASPTTSDSDTSGAAFGLTPTPAIPTEAVLIVDDSLSVRKIAEKYAAELGYLVETASDGLVALEKLQARRFALVLTDLEMPRMHGFELLAEIRSHEATRALPVIVVTSRQAAKHRERADALGANDYLIKPFSKAQLGNKMADCLRAAAAAAANAPAALR